MPQFDKEKVLVILLGLLVGDVLGEECLSHLREIIEKSRWQQIEPVLRHAFQADRKGEAHDWINAGVDHSFVPKVADMLY